MSLPNADNLWRPEDDAEALRLADTDLTLREIGDKMGRTRQAVKRRLQKLRQRAARVEYMAGAAHVTTEGMEREQTTDGEVITRRSRTLRDAEAVLAEAKVDLAVWEISRVVVNKWDMAAKVARGVGEARQENLEATELWQVKIWLRRRVPKTLADAVSGIIDRMTRHAPKYPKPPKLAKIKDAHLLVLGLYDLHFGKLAWARETGQDYDLKIAEKLYRRAGEELVSKASGFPVEKILLPVGQDFFHVDGLNNTTTAGTPQDTDGRLAKIFEAGLAAVVSLVDYLIGFAPCEIIWTPGNHDFVTSYHLCKTLSAWYRLCDRVKVDTEPAPRKAMEYGVNLLGLTHGNEEKHHSLPGIMAGSWPEAWGRTTHHEWLLGHWHKKKETHYVGGDTLDGVTVRILPSLAGTDAWHYRRGYVNNPRAAEAYLYSRERGYAGHLSVNANHLLKGV